MRLEKPEPLAYPKRIGQLMAQANLTEPEGTNDDAAARFPERT
jgi:hypothetical protein